jgi:two-component system, NtrC family, response regulator GlrR
MSAPHSLVVLILGSLSEDGHLRALKSILEQGNIEVLPTGKSLSSTEDYSAWLARIIIERRASAIILVLDEQALADIGSFNGFFKSALSDIPIIVAAENFEAPQICTMLKLGAADFITSPFTAASVLPRIWRLAKYDELRPNLRGKMRELLGIQQLELLGESPSFLEQVRKLPLIAQCDVTTLIQGETGTGKELIARAIHYLSPRHNRPFVSIDCGAIPPELAESELFGHERGAFTSAVAKNPGLVSAADRGTLFLDEVDGLRLSVQAKLLRFLQQKEYRPLGSCEIKKADVRVISATNSNLQQRVRKGEFREDLFYRLNVVPLQLPPLRLRQDDIALLARHFLEKYAARFKRPTRNFSPDALQRLLMYRWPGNIRELENVVEAAVALSEGPTIGAKDLLLESPESPAQLSFQEAKALAIREFERDYIARLICACGGNISEAARVAGKNRRAFWELVCKHKVDVRELRESSTSKEELKMHTRAAKIVDGAASSG